MGLLRQPSKSYSVTEVLNGEDCSRAVQTKSQVLDDTVDG